MDQNTSKVKDLEIGDLVTHVLYGEEWVGMILAFKEDAHHRHGDARSEKAMVQMQPGTKFEDFFGKKVSQKDRINERLGYVTTNWLFRLRIKDENSRPPRSKT